MCWEDGGRLELAELGQGYGFARQYLWLEIGWRGHPGQRMGCRQVCVCVCVLMCTPGHTRLHLLRSVILGKVACDG